MPFNLKRITDSILKKFQVGFREPDGIQELYTWLEIDGIGELCADIGDQLAIRLNKMDLKFFDNSIRDHLYIPDEVEIADVHRLEWARSRIDVALTEQDPDLLASIHTYPLQGSSGEVAYVCCIIEGDGLHKLEFDWWGLWATREEFYEAVGKQGCYWIAPWMGEMPDALILSIWEGT